MLYANIHITARHNNIQYQLSRINHLTLYKMPITIVSILILPVLLYMVSAHGVVPLAGTQEIPCSVNNESIISPRNGKFWELNQTNFEIRFSVPPACIYMVTEIAITTNVHKKEDINEYSISYKLNDSTYFVRLRDLSTSTSSHQFETRVKIKPLLFEEISIMKFINSSGNFSVKYELNGSSIPIVPTVRKGYSIPRVTVLNYLIAQPSPENLVESSRTYTGMCNGKICYGGRGELMDGFGGGNLTEANYSGATVRWKCANTSTVPTVCSYPMQFILTRKVHVSHIIIHGFKPRNEEIASPNISLIQPEIPNKQIINNISANNMYSIEIPINAVTDEIYLNIFVNNELALSEVEVFSNEVNIALLPNKYYELPPCNTNAILIIIIGSIIGVLIIMVILLAGFSIYITVKYRKVKQQLNTVKPPLSTIVENLKRNPTAYITDENSRYSQRSLNPDAIYSIIGPGLLANPMLQNTYDTRDAKIDTRHIIANAFTEMEGLTENPIYAGARKIPGSTETLETLLQTPIENCNNNYQDTNQVRKVEKLEIEKGETECERDDQQNETPVYEMRDNPIYKKVEFKSQKNGQLDLNIGDKSLSVYDVK